MAQNSRRPDSLLGGSLALLQPESGHRAGTDAVLLGACAPATAAGSALDFGAGAGAAGLVALARAPGLQMSFLEIDADSAGCCAQNLQLNGFSDRGRAIVADGLKAAARRAAGLRDGSYDLVLTNPPFHDAGAVRVTPDMDKARAHVAGEGGLAAWMKAALALLAPGGTFLMIHRADALGLILAAVEGRIGGVRIMPVQPKVDEPAIRLLVGGRKGSRGPLVVLPPLVLHEADGAFTARAEAIHRGDAGIDLRLH